MPLGNLARYSRSASDRRTVTVTVASPLAGTVTVVPLRVPPETLMALVSAERT